MLVPQATVVVVSSSSAAVEAVALAAGKGGTFPEAVFVVATNSLRDAKLANPSLPTRPPWSLGRTQKTLIMHPEAHSMASWQSPNGGWQTGGAPISPGSQPFWASRHPSAKLPAVTPNLPGGQPLMSPESISQAGFPVAAVQM